MDLKKPLTLPEQVQKLREHNIFISDEQAAQELLSRVSYYRLTGYALQFRKSASDSDCTTPITLEHLSQLYDFDAQLRGILRKYLETIEVYYRTLIAYHFSLEKCVRAPYDQHYDEHNYYNKVGFHHVMATFEREKEYFKDSLIVKHHMKYYDGKMPLWAMVELMSFSNTSKLYSSLYKSSQKRISDAVGVSPDVLVNHLHCLSVLRNKCSHAARLYNTEFNPPTKLSPSFLRSHPNISNSSLFAYIFVLLMRLPNGTEDRENLKTEISYLFEKHSQVVSLEAIGFPTNYKNVLKL